MRLKRFSVEEYDGLIASGAIATTSAVELIDGLLVFKDRSDTGGDPMSVGLRHRYSVNQFIAIASRLEGTGTHLVVNAPAAMTDTSEPEPDVMILRGQPDDYLLRHPSAADIVCLFEVSDSSLAYDRGRKLKVYESAGVELYVIVNLQEDVLEVYRREGDGFAALLQVNRGTQWFVPLSAGSELVLRPEEVLPPIAPRPSAR